MTAVRSAEQPIFLLLDQMNASTIQRLIAAFRVGGGCHGRGLVGRRTCDLRAPILESLQERRTKPSIDRSAFIKGALRAGLKSRGEGSVQRRMCNLSAIMELHGKVPVIGWKSLPNVGANMTPKIEAMMRERGLI